MCDGGDYAGASGATLSQSRNVISAVSHEACRELSKPPAMPWERNDVLNPSKRLKLQFPSLSLSKVGLKEFLAGPFGTSPPAAPDQVASFPMTRIRARVMGSIEHQDDLRFNFLR